MSNNKAPTAPDAESVVKRLRDLAARIAAADINGFGNECADIADQLAALTAQPSAGEPVARSVADINPDFDLPPIHKEIGVTRNVTATRAPSHEGVVVPMELTEDMAVAFCETWFSKVRCIDDAEMDDAYAAMLAAAPAATKEGE